MGNPFEEANPTILRGSTRQVFKFGRAIRGKNPPRYRLHFNRFAETENQARWFVISISTNQVVETGDDAQSLQIKYGIK